ncbi:hypothetical protein EH11_01066 [Bacillus subtilis]|nr:hypothetical protein [Bacillus subtilis]RPK04661.1 hypothetical protein EH11_01066 [Bacillus subtilis]RUS10333.1 hypothetical protein EFW59_01065 [Bacillus subtilis]
MFYRVYESDLTGKKRTQNELSDESGQTKGETNAENTANQNNQTR